jgi:hypothetical protein
MDYLKYIINVCYPGRLSSFISLISAPLCPEFYAKFDTHALLLSDVISITQTLLFTSDDCVRPNGCGEALLFAGTQENVRDTLGEVPWQCDVTCWRNILSSDVGLIDWDPGHFLFPVLKYR